MIRKKAMALTVGKTKRGRSKRRWSDYTKEDLHSIIGAVGTDAQDSVS